MDNYYVRNKTTNKLELHFDKETYMGLSDEQKKEIKSAFLFSRKSGAWVSRAKFPNLYRAEKIAEKLGLENAGCEGESLSFREQQEIKMQKAERRAERMEYRAGKAMERGEALQKSIHDMHGDIAFFTQPNINTSSGRAFTRRRKRMFDAWERGFDEFKKSEYYAERAEIARETASNKEANDKAFCKRRIDEAESHIRKLKKNIAVYEEYKQAIENGEKPKDIYGCWVHANADTIDAQLDKWYEMLEMYIDKTIYYHECIESAGGIQFSKDNLNKGDYIEIKHWGNHLEVVKIIRFGSKNITFEHTNSALRYADGRPFQGKCAYAEVQRVIKSA